MKKILWGDNMTHLKNIADNTFDACITDPPWSIKFMQAKWDYNLPSVETWKEILRVLKPGAHILVCCGTRTQHRMAVNIEDTGFEIRDILTHHFAQRFPKSMDIAKAIDRESGVEREVIGIGTSGAAINVGNKNPKPFHERNRNPEGQIEFKITAAATEDAKKWEGWGTALKPATEFWTLARKPISETTVAKNVLRWGTGAINIDKTKIEFRTDADKNSAVWGRGTDFTGGRFVGATDGNGKTNVPPSDRGRFPANLVLSHSVFCKFLGYKKVTGTATSNGDAQVGEPSKGVVSPIRRGKFIDRTDDDGAETVENWDCDPSCPVRIMDEQAPETGAFAPVASGHVGASRGIYGDYNHRGDDGEKFYDDGLAGASRFFYVAKPSKTERNKGVYNTESSGAVIEFAGKGAWYCLECGRKYNYTASQCPKCGSHNRVLYKVGSQAIANTHETVKPIKLMEYLIKMIVPKGGVLLDPFAGSGTTGCAAENLSVDYLLIEREEKHAKTAKERCEYYHQEAMVKNQPTIFDII